MLKEKIFPSYLVGRDRVIIVRWCGADLQGRPSKQAVLPRPSKYYIEVSTVFCPAANHLISWPTSSESRWWSHTPRQLFTPNFYGTHTIGNFSKLPCGEFYGQQQQFIRTWIFGDRANTGRGAPRERDSSSLGDTNNNNSIELLSKYVVSQLKKLPLDWEIGHFGADWWW